jgi:hypothetical protein
MLALTAHTLDLQSPHFQAVIQNIQGYTSDNAVCFMKNFIEHIVINQSIN